jgi:ketosteroid isomerase-like protein
VVEDSANERPLARDTARAMSQTNVEIVRRAIDRLSDTGEPDWDLYDADIVWTSRPDGPAHYTRRGLDGLRSGVESLREAWAEIRGETLETVESGDAVVSVIRWRLRGHGGIELDVVEGWATWIRDGKIVRIEQHASKQDALEAAGLGE